MRKIKYFTWAQLLAATIAGNKIGFNRQLNPDGVAKLDADQKYPVTFSMLHEHIAGELAEPHVRAVVAVDPTHTVTLDVEMSLFNSLPYAEV
jgi:hypothetical protein